MRPHVFRVMVENSRCSRASRLNPGSVSRTRTEPDFVHPEPAITSTAFSRNGSSHSAVPSPRPGPAPPQQPTYGVVLVSRNRLLVNALALALARTVPVSVVRTYELIEQATAEFGHLDHHPDVLVVDPGRGAQECATAIMAFRRAWPLVPVLVTSVQPNCGSVVALIQAGVRGLLTDDSGLDELVSAIRTVARGQVACASTITTLMYDAVAAGSSVEERAPAYPSLTPRERQVARLLERGMSNKEIARQLDIKLATVKNHVHNILAKLELASRGRVRGVGKSGSFGPGGGI